MKHSPRQASYPAVLAARENLRRALEQEEACPDQCFTDEATLTRCNRCKDNLAQAALHYAEATRRFRQDLTVEGHT